MFVAAHICFDRQIASRGRSKESKCSIQGRLFHLSRKPTAITGIGFLIPTSCEPCLPLPQSCLAPTGHPQLCSQAQPSALQHPVYSTDHCWQRHSLLPPPAATHTPPSMCFVSHQAHQNKATSILQVTRIQCTAQKGKQQQSILLACKARRRHRLSRSVCDIPSPSSQERWQEGASTISMDHSLSPFNAVYNRFYWVFLPTSLHPGCPLVSIPTYSWENHSSADSQHTRPHSHHSQLRLRCPAPELNSAVHHSAWQVLRDPRSSRGTPTGTQTSSNAYVSLPQAEHPSTHTQHQLRDVAEAQRSHETPQAVAEGPLHLWHFSCANQHDSPHTTSLMNPAQPRGARRHSGAVLRTPS